jgi:N-methylhydantoinase B/oxoprolinase/acetone carboxylase alpha subunit
MTRAPEAVLEDVRLGLYSREAAETLFGVVIIGDPPQVAMAETDALRHKAWGL